MARPAIQPRILTADEAAIYCGFRGARGRFPRWAKEHGLRPMPDREQTTYDRYALDAAIDRAAGGVAPVGGDVEWG